jgi:hypothetical protein
MMQPFTPRCLHKSKEIVECQYEDVFKNVHSSFIYNSKKWNQLMCPQEENG